MRGRDCLAWMGTLVLLGVTHMDAQSSGTPQPSAPAVSPAAQPATGVLYLSAADLAVQQKSLMAKAHTATNGSAGVTLAKYNGHFTMLTVRVKSGGGEFHKRNHDIFVAVDGEATVITGGRLVDPHDSSPDEIVGTSVEGGTAHVMRKGDVIHIPINTPHQTVLAPGKTFTYYVVKAIEPKA